MSIFVIGDLHLSFAADKPMDIYGGYWIEHTKTLKAHWEARICAEDTVILAGDTSWGLKLEEARADLDWIASLPGRKILIKGNHDLWWNTVSKLQRSFPSLEFLQNRHIETEGVAICGSRGWICPGDRDFTKTDEKIYLRELQRVKASLESAAQAGCSSRIGVIHYPPTNDQKENSGFTDLFEAYGVRQVFYGHLHGSDAHEKSLIGWKNGVHYQLVSCDYLRCNPMQLVELEAE